MKIHAWALVNPDGTIATGPSYDRAADMFQIFATVGTAQDAAKVRRAIAEVYAVPRVPYREVVKACTITID